MNKSKIRKITWRKDTFIQKIIRAYPALGIHPNEIIKEIKIFNNSVMLDIGLKEKRK